MVKQLVAASLCMALVACAMGGAKRSAQAPSTTEATAAAPTEAPAGAHTQTPMPDDPRAQIDELWRKVEDERVQLGLPEATPAAGAPVQAQPMSVPLSTDPSCRPAKTDRCTQSCTFSDSICKNAGSICRLAAQLTGDVDAADKCSRAKQTCERAHETCCTCK